MNTCLRCYSRGTRISSVMAIITCSVLLGSLAFATEAPPSVLWDVSHDNGSARGVAVGSDGHAVAVGGSFATGTNIWRVIKHDGGSGATLWDVTFDNRPSDGIAFGVAIGLDGNPVVTGDSCAPGRICDIRTIKYDGTNGTVLWNVTLDGGERDVGFAVAVGSDGNPVVAGGSCAQTPARGCDFRIIKYNGLTGGILWTRTFDTGSDNEFATGVTVDSDGNAFVVGERCNPAGTAPQDCRTVVIKFSGPTGAVLWSVIFSGGNATSVAVGLDQNPVVGGSSCGSPACDFRVMKLNGSSGDVIWSTASNAGAGEPDVSGVAVGTDDNPVATGIDNGVIRTVKYDGATGQIIWNIFRSGGNGNGIAVGPDNNPVVAAEPPFRVIKYQTASTISTQGKVTGGGFIQPDGTMTPATLLIQSGVNASVGDKATFGVVVQFAAGDPNPTGNLQYNDHAAKVTVRALSFTLLNIGDGVCGLNTHAKIRGSATVTGPSRVPSTQDFEVEVDDCGGPSSTPPDTFKITTTGPTSYMAIGPVIGGNITISKQ